MDGQVFREFCRLAGVNKRRTTPYHPQCDGMAERHIGLVKQIIRCLQADRHLPKASWPGLLTEVSFHINGMKNATSRLSPHILTFGREPHSPLDAWCENLSEGERNSHEEYLHTLKKKKGELEKIARDSIERNLSKVRQRYNAGKRETEVDKGDMVMLKSNITKDSLSPRYDGPFLVIERRGPDVKLRLTNKYRWVHLNNVKKYAEPNQSMMHGTSQLQGGNQATVSDEADDPREQSIINEDSEDDMGGHNLTNEGPDLSPDPPATDLGGVTLPEVDAGNSADSEEEPERRYPQRVTRMPSYLADYTMGSKVTPQTHSNSHRTKN